MTFLIRWESMDLLFQIWKYKEKGIEPCRKYCARRNDGANAKSAGTEQENLDEPIRNVSPKVKDC